MLSSQTLNRQRDQAVFKRLISADLHDGWWPTSLPAGLPWRAHGRRAHSAMSLHLRERWGLEELDQPSMQHADPALLAVCQLPGPRLARLVLYLGIVFTGGEVRRALDRREREAYCQALGDDLYRFALQGATLFGQPETDEDGSTADPATLLVRARDVGLTILQRVVAPLGTAASRRLELKLPPAWAGRPASRHGLGLSLPALRRITVRLLRYIEPQWTENQPSPLSYA